MLKETAAKESEMKDPFGPELSLQNCIVTQKRKSRICLARMEHITFRKVRGHPVLPPCGHPGSPARPRARPGPHHAALSPPQADTEGGVKASSRGRTLVACLQRERENRAREECLLLLSEGCSALFVLPRASGETEKTATQSPPAPHCWFWQ